MRRCALAASARSRPSCAASSRTARATTPAVATLQHKLLSCPLGGVMDAWLAEPVACVAIGAGSLLFGDAAMTSGCHDGSLHAQRWLPELVTRT
jgi:hypothetical protein